MKFWTPAVEFNSQIVVPSRELPYQDGSLLDGQVPIGTVVIRPAVAIPADLAVYRVRVPGGFGLFHRVRGTLAAMCPPYGVPALLIEGWERTE